MAMFMRVGKTPVVNLLIVIYERFAYYVNELTENVQTYVF